MNSTRDITLTLAEHKHGVAFDVYVFCREFDGACAKVCVGKVGRENQIASLHFGDYLIYEVDTSRYEVRLIEAKAARSDPQAVFLVTALPPASPAILVDN